MSGKPAPPLGKDVEDRAVSLFKDLLRIDTTNPPGNEKPAAELCAERLFEQGVEPRIIETAPGRACVVARVKGDGSKPPVLLSGHLDVVPADPADWTHPPFAAHEADGFIWGRGAVDMKHHVAMSVTVLGQLAERGISLERDVIFAGVADEEAGSRLGAQYLCKHHPELVRAEYGLGELGGFTLAVNGRPYYPIQIAEKGFVWMRLKAKGTAGHGSMPREDGAIIRLAEAVAKIGRTRLPVHVTEPVRQWVKEMAAHQPFPARAILPLILSPLLTERVQKIIPDPNVARVFASVLSNTISPTILSAGNKSNVIPGEATATLDGRILPGQDSKALVAELEALLGEEREHFEIEIIDEQTPTSTTPDGPLWEALVASVNERDPEGIPIPYVIPGFTDGGSFKELGVRWFGFAPLRFPKDSTVSYPALYHGVDERAPVEGLRWGVETLWNAVTRFCGK